nr:hypothetical protein OH820_29410 [Streptomyces sp. NBC_00857]
MAKALASGGKITRPRHAPAGHHLVLALALADQQDVALSVDGDHADGGVNRNVPGGHVGKSTSST